MSQARVAQVLFEAAGMVANDNGIAIGRCSVCGCATSQGVQLSLPETFMDWDKLVFPEGGIICPACKFGMAERSEELAKRVGKDRPQCMRNYSHFVVDGVWYPLSKAQKRRQYEMLLRRPAVAIIAISGQKHLILRAQLDRWQIEENSIAPDLQGLEKLYGWMMTLYLGKFSKSEIETGQYLPYRVARFGIESWRNTELELRDWRGSAIFDLALFLCQKEESTDESERDGGQVCQLGLDAVAGN